MLLDNILYNREEKLIPPVGRSHTCYPNTQTGSLKEKVLRLVIRDLMRLNWSVDVLDDKVEILPPMHYDKNTIKESMTIKRKEILDKNRTWIDKHIDLARANLANGYDALISKIRPTIEICNSQKQHDIFRIFRYYWSSPYSEYVGRRIKFIVRDSSLPNNPIIGIAALGSPIIHIPERDKYIGWDKETRTRNLNYMMDAYVIGALPPYNYLLGGKLVSYILASREIREMFYKKYSTTKYNQLAGIFTTSLYGKSSQYNRLKLNNKLLYSPIGETRGFGTLHITNETFDAMNYFLKDQGVIVSNCFGKGPSWRMRVIRNAGELLGFDSDHLLRHSFKRSIYFVPLARNSISFLNGSDVSLKYYRQSINSVTRYWKNRWYQQRKENSKIIEQVKLFRREIFSI